MGGLLRRHVLVLCERVRSTGNRAWLYKNKNAYYAYAYRQILLNKSGIAWAATPQGGGGGGKS